MCTTHTPQSAEVKVRSGERETVCMSEVYYEWLGMNYYDEYYIPLSLLQFL